MPDEAEAVPDGSPGWYGIAFVSPGILFFLVFFVYPVVSALSWSLTSYDLATQPKFIGLDNFTYMASAEPFDLAHIRIGVPFDVSGVKGSAAAGTPLVLTDDYAPVDRLTAPRFLERTP